MAGYATLGAAGYGASDFIGGIASRKSRIPAVLVVSQTVSLAAMLAAAALIGGIPNGPDIIRGAVAGVLVFAGITLVYAAFARGDIGPSASLLGVFSALVPFLAAYVTGTVLAPTVGVVGVTCAAGAIYAFADGSRENRSWVSLAYAIGSGVAFGSYQVVMSRTASSGGMWPLVAAQCVVVLAALTWLGVDAERTAGPLNLPPLAVVAGLVEAAGSVAALWAVRTGNLAVVGVILALAPAVSVLLARVVLGERMTVRRVAGLGLAGVAVLVLSGASVSLTAGAAAGTVLATAVSLVRTRRARKARHRLVAA